MFTDFYLNIRKVSKKLGFFVLQDAHGQVQLMARAKGNKDKVDPEVSPKSEPLDLLDRLPLQSVLQISGTVQRRIPSAVTPVSIFISHLTCLIVDRDPLALLK